MRVPVAFVVVLSVVTAILSSAHAAAQRRPTEAIGRLYAGVPTSEGRSEGVAAPARLAILQRSRYVPDERDDVKRNVPNW